jgi:hypothetical protein
MARTERLSSPVLKRDQLAAPVVDLKTPPVLVPA